MERWQSEYITAKRPVLIEYTICNTNFLSILRSKGVLAAVDLDQLDAIKNLTGQSAQANLMYNIIVTRVGSYDAIIQALHQTHQTGARNILMYGYVRHGILPPFDFAEQIFEWNSEHFSLHNEILSKFVKVQNKKVLLADFCNKINPEKLKDIMENTIDKMHIFEILNKKCDFVLISNTIPDKVEYYIPRTLTKRTLLNESILRDNERDIFVVKGATWNQLTKMTSSNNIVDRSRNQLERLTVRHILCELDEDFETICAISHSKEVSIHLLNFKNGSLEWIRTHGSIKSLHCYINENQERIYDKMLIENLTQNSMVRHAPVCISDTPGMGKTILLTEIANDINSAAEENALVFFFVLREFVQHLPTKVKDITADKIRELISIQVTTSKFGKEIVQYLLNCTGQNIELCFDGFDEILETQIETTKTLLKVIRYEFNNTRLHITTRPHMRQQLEETLGVLGYNILPFEENDQINFLVNFWKSTQQLSSDRVTMLKKFAQRCLSTLKEKMVEDEQDIAGVPLQCRLFGEIYQKQVERMLLAPAREDDDVPLLNSIYQMYHNLMQLRFERAKKQQKIKDGANYGTGKLIRVMTNRKPWTIKVKEVHFIIATEVLFPELLNAVKIIFPINHHKYINSRDLYSLGLIQAKVTFDKNYRFSHRTFAEFLVAEFLVNVMTSKYRVNRKQEFWNIFLNFLFNDILKTISKSDVILERGVTGVNSRVKVTIFGNSVIAYFINAHLKKNTLTSWELVDIYKYIRCVKIHDSTFHSIFTACAASNLEYLFHFLMILFKTMKQHAFELPAELLITAAKYSGFEFNRTIHNLFTDNVTVTFDTDSNKHTLVTPSQTVVQRGNQPVLQVLLNKYKTTCINKNLLHVCLTGSHFDRTEIIFRKLEIIKLLLEQAPHLCNEKLKEDGTTPILQPFSHLELIQCLLANGADVNAISKNNENVLHVFLHGSDKYKIEECVLVELLRLLKTFNFTDYNRVNSNGEVPLSLALRTTSLTANCLQHFKNQGTDFTFVNKDGENLLHAAIINQQSIDCLEQLNIFGAGVNAIDSNFENLVHTASDVGHKEAVEFLIKKASDLVNTPNENGNTPLHVAFTKNSKVHLQIQNILIKNGANLRGLNNDENTPVAHGLEHSTELVVNVERLKSLEMTGYNLSADNVDRLLRAILLNESAASWEFSEELCKLISFLFSVGGRVRCDNGDNPVDVNSVKLCLSKICQGIYSSMFTKPVPTDPTDAFQQIGSKMLENNNYTKFFNDSKFNFQSLSMESMILILLCLKERKLFRVLQKAYQLLLVKSTRFTAPIDGLVDFLDQVNQNICVILTDNIILSIAAVQDTIDSSILVVDMINFKNVYSDQNNPVVVIVSENDISYFLHAHENTTSKIIYIVKYSQTNYNKISKIQKVEVIFKHKYKWESLSTRFQNQLLLQRSKNHKDTNTFNAIVSKLYLTDLETDSVFSADFLIPKHLKSNLRGLFGKDVLTKYPTNYEIALQQHVFQQFFPLLTYSRSISHDNLEVSDKLKEFARHGPTASYLAALWIYKNLNLILESDEGFTDQLFSYVPANMVIINPVTKSSLKVRTYEFKHWLLLYFLEHFAALFSTQKLTPIKSRFEEHILLHCCINLHAPNLLKLFDRKFYLASETLLVAASRGNVHLFHKENAKLTHHKLLDKISFSNAVLIAVEKVHLLDVDYFIGHLKSMSNFHENSCDDIIRVCVENTLDNESETVQRKLLVLTCFINSNIISAENIKFAISGMQKVHPELIKYLIRSLVKFIPDAQLSELFINNLSAYLRQSQFEEIIRFILEHRFHHLLSIGDKSNVPLLCKAFRLLGRENESLFSLLPNVLTSEDISLYLENAASCNKERHILDIILRHFKNYSTNRNELHVAIHNEHVDAVRFFILHGANVNTVCRCCGKNPLHLCVTASSYVPEIFNALLHFGACPTQDTVKLLPKHLSPKHYQSTVQRLLDKDWGKIFEPSSKMDSILLDLDRYYFEVSMETVNQLVKYVDCKEKLNSCLFCSAIERKRDVVELEYIKKWSVDVPKTCCHHELSPLHIAAKYGNIQAAEYLLGSGHNVNSKCKCCKSTPLHWCFKNNLDGVIIEEMVTLLLKHGADIDKRNTRSVSVYEQALTLNENQPLPNNVLLRMSIKSKRHKK